jgi:hypothetical protein
LNLGATCFRTEWRARANFRRLLLRDSPSSQPPRLLKFNLGSALPTKCTNYSVLPESRFCHTSCTLGFKCIFKLVDFLSSGMETPCAFAPSGGPAPTSEGCSSETRPLASRPDCRNSISALLRLQGVPTTVYCQMPHLAVHLYTGF